MHINPKEPRTAYGVEHGNYWGDIVLIDTPQKLKSLVDITQELYYRNTNQKFMELMEEVFFGYKCPQMENKPL